MKKADIWGQCCYRHMAKKQIIVREDKLMYAYFCLKSGNLCDPNYCLGPDGDEEKEDKIDENEG